MTIIFSFQPAGIFLTFQLVCTHFPLQQAKTITPYSQLDDFWHSSQQEDFRCSSKPVNICFSASSNISCPSLDQTIYFSKQCDLDLPARRNILPSSKIFVLAASPNIFYYSSFYLYQLHTHSFLCAHPQVTNNPKQLLVLC